MDLRLGTGILIAACALSAFFGVQAIYLLTVLVWEDRRTVGLRYYGRQFDHRQRFKRTLQCHARLLQPILRLFSMCSPFRFERSSFAYSGIWAPKGTCDRTSFERAEAYEPCPEDVFVVTHMKSGTTWMQHLLYQILLEGNGSLVESGQTLYAVSPWLEGRKSVPIEQAPLVGLKRPSRLIKTHLSASLCPYGIGARYVYVARHPVSCFASCVDFLAENTGPFAPTLEAVEQWFCSEHMWWGPWPAHVEGWWRRSMETSNVFFTHFEEMKRNLGKVALALFAFLGLSPPCDLALKRILEKCGFGYMQQRAEAFEMFPPHLLATHARLFVRGNARRHRDVPQEIGQRIRAWCATELQDASYPLAQSYANIC